MNHSRRRPRSSCSSITRPACSSASSRHRRAIRSRPTCSDSRAAALLDIPAILTTSEEESENGALLPALEQILPGAHASRIDRHGIIDSLADPAVVEAIEATGRRQLVTAGIGTEVCGVASALHACRDGYHVAFVADACGSATALGHDLSLRRLEQNGVTLTTTASVSAELAGDYRKHAQIMFG